jgi:hypothetical protein
LLDGAFHWLLEGDFNCVLDGAFNWLLAGDFH